MPYPTIRRFRYHLGCLPLLVPQLLALPNREAYPTTTSDNAPTSTTEIPRDAIETPTALNPTPAPPDEAAATSSLGADPPTDLTNPQTGSIIPNGQTSNNDHDSGVVNLYFLLLGLFVALIILIYWILARRRRTRRLAFATGREHALAADLNNRSGASGGGHGRSRRSTGRPTSDASSDDGYHQEGLDERGEAPPPYLAKMPAAVTVDGRRNSEHEEGIELRTMEHGDASAPPGYTPPTPPTPAAGRDTR